MNKSAIGRVINLTPHEITIVSNYGEANIPPSGKIARVAQEEPKLVGTIGNTGDSCVPIQVVSPPVFGAIEWPEFDTDAYVSVIVSMVVGQAVQRLPVAERPEFAVFVPDTSPASAERDEDGQIASVSRLVVYSWSNQAENE